MRRNIKIYSIVALLCAMFCNAVTSRAALTANKEYYIWLNIYEKLLGSNAADDAPSLSAYGKNTTADSYVFVAEASGTDGYVLLRQKSSGKYLAASSSSAWGVVFESSSSKEDRFCWKVDEGTYTYLINKKSGNYLGVDGANKGADYVSVYYDKPKGSHSQFSAIPVVGSTWSDARQAYESSVYTNTQGVKEIDYCQLNNKTIDRSDAVDIHITSNDNPILGSTTVNLGSDRTWLIFDNIVPSKVISTYLKYVTINGVAAKNGTNCRVAIYLNGAAVIPLPSNIMSCQGTTGDFTLAVGNHTDLKTNSNAMTSFVLRRGYMATLATGASGEGYSRVYVADHADLEITLPDALTKRVTSVNVKNWQYLSKKGWADTKGATRGPELRASWFWSWSAGYSSTTDMEYVPCRQHKYWPSKSDVNNKTATAAMSLNEPEHSEQHTSDKCSCGGTIDAWTACTITPDFLAGGGRIGSPQPTDFSYMNQYFGHVDDMAYRCDFAITHAYWAKGGRSESAYADWFVNQCKNVWNNTGRPLWITELEIGATWITDDMIADYTEYRKYLQVLLQKIEECDWIERYAIYPIDYWKAYMFYDDGGITPAGQVYRDHRSTFAYHSNYTKVPNWWAPSMKSPTLDYTLSASNNTLTFKIGNPNTDYTETLILQRKSVGGDWEDIYSVTDRSQFEQSSISHTVSLDDINRESDQFRVISTNIFGKSATSDDVATGYITNPEIVTSSKTNVPGWTCVKNAYSGFTKAESGDTYLEAWSSSAALMDFNYYQDVNDIPNGVYQLSAVCFNSTDKEEGATGVNGNFGLYAVADGIGYFAPVTIDSEIDYDTKTTIDKVVVRNGSVRIGIRNIGQMSGRWAGADNFSLLYLGTEKEVLGEEKYSDFVYDAEESVINRFPVLADSLWDASGLIGNADCKRGTTDFWAVSNIAVDKGKAWDGDANNQYFNIWKSGGYTSSMEQTIDYLPAGTYTLSALIRGSQDKPLTLKAKCTDVNGISKAYSASVNGNGETAVAGTDYQNGWQKVEVEDILIERGDRLTITAEFAPSETAWWSVDHFQLAYKRANKIEEEEEPEEEPNAIVSAKSDATTESIYTLDGRKVNGTLSPGIYIVKAAGNVTRKILVK
ncbi:MAG: RICIN domain-containing protein [Prevotellaceae bacterium]|nr:RICIN domain-containing protein [Prevotellaceae bacterium]